MDYRSIELFVGSGHAFARKWLPADVITRLENFLHDPSQPPALVLRGLPFERELPPTGPEGQAIKQSDRRTLISETLLVGIARIIGQPFIYEHLAGEQPGMSRLVRNIYPTPAHEEVVSATGSKKFLDMHSDFFHGAPPIYPHAILFVGLRGDPSQTAKTLLCDNRQLYEALDPLDVELLRREPITWCHPNNTTFSKHIIEGPKESPAVNIFDENVNYTGGGFEKIVQGKVEVVAAYKRLKEKAKDLALKDGGVWLGNGDVLILNQRRVSHGRTCFTGKYDGSDRWMQRVYANEGCIWQPTGFVPWPVRALPFRFQ